MKINFFILNLKTLKVNNFLTKKLSLSNYHLIRPSRVVVVHEEGVQPRELEVLAGRSRPEERARIGSRHQKTCQGNLGVSSGFNSNDHNFELL